MIKQSDVVYISAPMSGIVNDNVEAIRHMEKILIEAFGCTVLSPARHPRGGDYTWYMARAMEDMQQASVMVILPGWGNSIGASFEQKVAVKINLPVWFASQDFPANDHYLRRFNPERMDYEYIHIQLKFAEDNAAGRISIPVDADTARFHTVVTAQALKGWRRLWERVTGGNGK